MVRNNRVIDATWEHIEFMKPIMRYVDERECIASSGKSAGEALQDAYKISLWTKVILNEANEPCCAFGVVPWTKDKGVPWLLATECFDEITGVLKRISHLAVKQMLLNFSYLENYVDARSEIAIRFLEWLGFNIEEPIPFGKEDLPFHRFWLKRG